MNEGGGADPDFVIRDDGELVPTRDLRSGDLDRLARGETPEAHIRSGAPGSAPHAVPSSIPPAPSAGPRRPPPPPAVSSAQPPPPAATVRRPAPPPAPPALGRPPTERNSDGSSPRFAAVSPDAPPPAPRPSPSPGGWGSDDLDLDTRSLAEVAFEVSGTFDSLELSGPQKPLPPPTPARPPPPPASTMPPRAPTSPQAVAPSRREGVPGGAASVVGVGAPAPSGAAPKFQPRAVARPARERGSRHQSGPLDYGEGGGDLQRKADVLYREAMKEVAVGNLGGARRNLQLAASFSPTDPRIQRALQSLPGAS